ncbi:unnamed protein product [Clavelina lepadiformis]|uniref:Uncharacterized protein n=1 Tax=Clavelina lepadiformis TaxID=159417 RepID=A0ABP0GML5_CLALP
MGKIVFLWFIVLSYAWRSVFPAEGLTCWVCENQSTNEECQLNGRIQRCQSNQQACQNELRRDSNGMRITKRCKQALACDNNYIQNPRAAWQPAQCNWKTPSSVCRCCCSTDLCNAPELGCTEVRDFVQCDPMPAPRFGRVSCDEDGMKIGAKCKFACRKGFQMSGNERSECVKNDGTLSARFDKPPPVCEPLICRPPQRAPTNGLVTCSDGNSVGSVCKFACAEGFYMTGNDTRTCMKGKRNRWDNNRPSCNPFLCNPPHTDPLNGAVVCSKGNALDSKCQFTCKGGYFLNGSPLSTCGYDVTHGKNANWDYLAPTCDKISCPPLFDLLNGDIRCSDSNDEGSICRFFCIDGYALDGASTATCLDEIKNDDQGEWSAPLPNCLKITCLPRHIAPINGNMECSDDNSGGSVCRFSCHVGYQVNGSPRSVCRDDGDGDASGAWTQPRATCLKIRCRPSHDHPTNGGVTCTDSNKIESVCRFTCNEGYSLIGSPDSHCEDDFDDDSEGRWSSLAPTCRRIICSPPHRDPEHGSVFCNDGNNEGSVCSFSCIVGYRLEGRITSTCQNDEDGNPGGEWSHPAPVCARIVCDPPFTAIENGDFECTLENYVGSSCSFVCKDDTFELVGFENSVCIDDGDNLGTWSSPAPTCAKKRCNDTLKAPENGFIVCDDERTIESQCKYSCEPLYEMVGLASTTCVESLGTVIWENETPPTCRLKKCQSQDLPHGEVTCEGDGTQVDNKCSFQCLDEFDLYPPDVTDNVCLNDTTWNVPRPCCARSCPPYAVMDFVIVMDSSSSIGDKNWAIMKNFVRNILQSFEVSLEYARLAVFRYNRIVDVETEIVFNDFASDREGFLRAFDEIPYDGRGTNTGRALKHARDVIFTQENGDRPGIRDVLLVITDGKSQDDVDDVSEDLREHGVLTYALGVVPLRGTLNEEQLLQISGSRDNMMIAERGFEQLTEEFSISLSGQICGDPCANDKRAEYN